MRLGRWREPVTDPNRTGVGDCRSKLTLIRGFFWILFREPTSRFSTDSLVAWDGWEVLRLHQCSRVLPTATALIFSSATYSRSAVIEFKTSAATAITNVFDFSILVNLNFKIAIFLSLPSVIAILRSLGITMQVSRMFTHNWSLQYFSQDYHLASHTTYVVCVNF